MHNTIGYGETRNSDKNGTAIKSKKITTNDLLLGETAYLKEHLLGRTTEESIAEWEYFKEIPNTIQSVLAKYTKDDVIDIKNNELLNELESVIPPSYSELHNFGRLVEQGLKA